MKEAIKRLLKRLLRDYQVIRIYHRDVKDGVDGAAADGRPCDIRLLDSPAQVEGSSDARIREHAWYVGPNARVYGLYDDRADLVCICAFWLAGHTGMPSRFADLAADEAVMVDLLTAARSKGKGYALMLTRHAERDLMQLGKRRLRTWVWHSNAPSIRVFEKAGWVYSHLLVELQPWGMKSPLRVRLPAFTR